MQARMPSDGQSVRRVSRMPDRFDRDRAFSIELGADRDDAVQQMIVRLAMFRTVKQKPRVRRNIKRRFGQAVILEIHAQFSAENLLPVLHPNQPR